MLEQMAPEIQREKQDAADAKDFLDMLQSTYAEAGGKLKSARSELERAQRDMGRAAQQREQARTPIRGRPPRGRPRQHHQRPHGGAEGDAGYAPPRISPRPTRR